MIELVYGMLWFSHGPEGIFLDSFEEFPPCSRFEPQAECSSPNLTGLTGLMLRVQYPDDSFDEIASSCQVPDYN